MVDLGPLTHTKLCPNIIGIHGKAKSGKDELASIFQETFNFIPVKFAKTLKEFAVHYFEVPPNHINEKRTKDSRRILQGIGTCVRKNAVIMEQILSNEANKKHQKGESGFPRWVEEMALLEFDIRPENLKRKLKYNHMVLNGILNLWTEKVHEFKEMSYHEIGCCYRSNLVWVNYLKADIQKLTKEYDAKHNSTSVKQILNLRPTFVISDVRYENEKKMLGHSWCQGVVIKIVRVDKPEIEIGANHASETSLDQEKDWFYTVVNDHKPDWAELLLLSAINIVRKMDHHHMFTTHEKAAFNIKTAMI